MYSAGIKKCLVLCFVLFIVPLIYRYLGDINPLLWFETWLFSVFASITQYMPYNPVVLTFVYLNHSYEKIMNIVVMIVVVIVLLIYYKDRRKVILWNFLFIVVTLELYVLFNDIIFFKMLKIGRHSPSVVLNEHYIAELYGSVKIKYFSYKSFPAGHAFAFFYWCFSTCLYVGKRVKLMLVAMAVFFSMPRVFVGAHWLSDVIFSAYEAYVLVYIAEVLMVKYRWLNFIRYQEIRE